MTSQQEIVKEWELFWGISPEGSLKYQKGKDVLEFWLSKLASREAKVVAIIREKMNEYDKAGELKQYDALSDILTALKEANQEEKR